MALMTLQEAKAAGVVSDRSDAGLQMLLDATEKDLVDHVGPQGEHTVVLSGGTSVWLPQPAESVATVQEYALDPDSAEAATGFALDLGGRRLYKTDGSDFRDYVTVTYTPVDNIPRLKQAQLQLIQVHLQQDGIDDLEEGQQSIKHADFAKSRMDILGYVTNNYGGSGMLA